MQWAQAVDHACTLHVSTRRRAESLNQHSCEYHVLIWNLKIEQTKSKLWITKSRNQKPDHGYWWGAMPGSLYKLLAAMFNSQRMPTVCRCMAAAILNNLSLSDYDHQRHSLNARPSHLQAAPAPAGHPASPSPRRDLSSSSGRSPGHSSASSSAAGARCDAWPIAITAAQLLAQPSQWQAMPRRLRSVTTRNLRSTCRPRSTCGCSPGPWQGATAGSICLSQQAGANKYEETNLKKPTCRNDSEQTIMTNMEKQVWRNISE